MPKLTTQCDFKQNDAFHAAQNESHVINETSQTDQEQNVYTKRVKKTVKPTVKKMLQQNLFVV